MLRNKDILELKRRFKKEACTITKMCGCYVDANKNKVVELNETFLNLEDEEFYKYLDIAKSEEVIIQRGKTETFVLSMQKHLTPDEDLARAISMDDLLSGVKEDIREMYRTAKQ